MMLKTADPVLEIRDLSVSVGTDEGEARILDNASLALMPGSIHGVVGESGCGKSTLMRAILGIGATPPSPDWGLAIAESREYLPDSWWAVTFPGVAILITVLGFNLLGDGLRDLVDPRLRRSR